jgi:hypothetical protein
MKMFIAAAALLAGLSAAPASAGPLVGPTAASPITITDLSSGRIARGQLKKIVPAKRIAVRQRLLQRGR